MNTPRADEWRNRGEHFSWRPAEGDASPVDIFHVEMGDPAAPVLLLSAGDDGVWPSTRLCEIAMARVDGRQTAGSFVHRHFPKAGHALGTGVPNVPTTGARVAMGVGMPPLELGGTPAADARARRESWPDVIDFLRSALAD